MSGKVVHFEIPYDDGARAQKFYGDVFGWQLIPVPDMSYTMVMTGPSDPETGPSEPGFINGGMFGRSDEFPGKGPNIVIDVPSVDEALVSVEAAGGKVVTPKMAVGDMGFAGYFTDPEGNLMGLWETAQRG
jgi:predicted enzyme related to lactoylglutathione lyase